MAAIGLIIVFSTTLILGERNNQPAPYLRVSGILVLAAVSAIFGGFTKDSSLWPSELWRYAGIAVNGIGVVGFGLALVHIKHLKNSQ